MGVFDDPIDVQQIQNPINWQLERKKHDTNDHLNLRPVTSLCLFVFNHKHTQTRVLTLFLPTFRVNYQSCHYQIIGFPIQSLSYG